MRPPPLAHASGENLLDRAFGLLPHPLEDLIKRLARPERLFKIVALISRRSVIDQLLDDDCPRPERGQDQHHHHDLDRYGRPQKERQKREIDLTRRAQNFRFHARALPLPAAGFARLFCSSIGGFGGRVETQNVGVASCCVARA